MPINVDFTGVKTTPEPLPLGSYTARIESVEEGISKTNNPKLDVVYVLTHQGFEGRKAFQSPSLQKNSLFNLKRILLATGNWDEEDLIGGFSFEPADVIGLEVCIVIVANNYKNSGGEWIHTTKVDRALDVSEAEGPSGDVSAAVTESVEGDVGTLFGSGGM